MIILPSCLNKFNTYFNFRQLAQHLFKQIVHSVKNLFKHLANLKMRFYNIYEDNTEILSRAVECDKNRVGIVTYLIAK